MSKEESNVRDVEKPEEVNFEKVVEPKQNSKILSFTTASMVNAASGTLMVQIANTFKEFEIEGFKSKNSDDCLKVAVKWTYCMKFSISYRL